MLKLKTASNTGSDKLTRDPTRPAKIYDPVTHEPVPSLGQTIQGCLLVKIQSSYFFYCFCLFLLLL